MAAVGTEMSDFVSAVRVLSSETGEIERREVAAVVAVERPLPWSVDGVDDSANVLVDILLSHFVG
jgi:hypothetical protein